MVWTRVVLQPNMYASAYIVGGLDEVVWGPCDGISVFIRGSVMRMFYLHHMKYGKLGICKLDTEPSLGKHVSQHLDLEPLVSGTEKTNSYCMFRNVFISLFSYYLKGRLLHSLNAQNSYTWAKLKPGSPLWVCHMGSKYPSPLTIIDFVPCCTLVSKLEWECRGLY